MIESNCSRLSHQAAAAGQWRQASIGHRMLSQVTSIHQNIMSVCQQIIEEFPTIRIVDRSNWCQLRILKGGIGITVLLARVKTRVSVGGASKRPSWFLICLPWKSNHLYFLLVWFTNHYVLNSKGLSWSKRTSIFLIWRLNSQVYYIISKQLYDKVLTCNYRSPHTKKSKSIWLHTLTKLLKFGRDPPLEPYKLLSFDILTNYACRRGIP